jgi:ubiquitin carboxyl-terminal hydrolase L5
LGSELNQFRSSTNGMTPRDRGIALDGFAYIRRIHNSFSTEIDRLNVELRLKQDYQAAMKAKKAAASTKRGRRKRKTEEEIVDQENGFHFVAYVPAGGCVWRMDGMEPFPRRIGELGESWVMAVLPEIQTTLGSAEGSGLEYSLLSLTSVTDSASLEDDRRRMERVREDWNPFIATLMRLHANRGDLKEKM